LRDNCGDGKSARNLGVAGVESAGVGRSSGVVGTHARLLTVSLDDDHGVLCRRWGCRCGGRMAAELRLFVCTVSVSRN